MCKICKLPDDQLNQVNQRILKGVSYTDVATWLLSQNIKVSHMTIKRHHDAGHCGEKRKAVIPIPIEHLQGLDISQKNLFNNSRAYLKAIYAMQLNIVAAKIRDYQGLATKFPNSELHGLKVILECLYLAARGADFILKDTNQPNETEKIKQAYQNLIDTGHPQAVIAAFQALPRSETQNREALLREIRRSVYGIHDEV